MDFLLKLNLFQMFIVIMLLLVLSFRLGIYLRDKKYKDTEFKSSTFLIEGMLLSMLLSFTFSMAAGKYDKRRSLFAEEINCISTVLLRIQLYPDSVSSVMMGHMSAYLDSRIEYYEMQEDYMRIDSVVAVSDSISRLIFRTVVNYAENTNNLLVTQQTVPALNAMFDCVTLREIYREAKVPISVLRLLFLLILVFSFLNGYNQGSKNLNWAQAIGFFVLICSAFLLIMDLNDNRSGKINLDKEQKKLIELRQHFDDYR